MIYLGELELKAVQVIKLQEERDTVAHSTVSTGGEALQDLGRKRASIHINGIFTGKESSKNTSKLVQMLRQGEPVSFKAETVPVDQVLVRKAIVSREAGKAQHVLYEIELEEWQTTSSTGVEELDSAVVLVNNAIKVSDTISKMSQEMFQNSFI
ncbi:MAG: DNA circularization N-terminal domain-containing protein [Candidatus Brocadiae bacterium]|nr:DNA circularization N-terminal domain-containing protein [Candidatus Brocadiia bacterium]